MLNIRQRIVLVAVWYLAVGTAFAQNITKILDGLPSFSVMNRLLSETGVAREINTRKPITLLAPDNSATEQALSSLKGKISTEQLGDIVRYHALLQYFDVSELEQIVKKQRLQVTTLYQATGRAEGILGFVNITTLKGSLHVSTPTSEHLSSATIVRSIKQIPYNISICQLSSLLVPVGLLSLTSPPVSAPVTAVPGSGPHLSPLLIPSSTLEPAAAPISTPVPVPAPNPTPAAVPVSSPPEPPADSASPLSEAPSAPSKNSASPCSIPLKIIIKSLLGDILLLYLLHL